MLRCLLLLLLAAATSAQDHPLRIPGCGLTVVPAAGWTQAKAIDGAALVLRGPVPADAALDAVAREHARPSLAIAVQPMSKDQTSGGIALDAFHDLDRLLTHFDPLRDGDYTRVITGRTWYCWHYTFQLGQLAFEQALFITVAGDAVIYATGSCDHEHFAAHRAEIDAMIESMGGSRQPVMGK